MSVEESAEEEEEDEVDLTWQDLPPRPVRVIDGVQAARKTSLSAEAIAASISGLGGLSQGRLPGASQEETGLIPLSLPGFSSANLPPIDEYAARQAAERAKGKDDLRPVVLQTIIGEDGFNCSIESKETITFILVARKAGSDDLWLAPKLQLFWDFYGLVDSALSGPWKGFDPVVDWANKWGCLLYTSDAADE